MRPKNSRRGQQQQDPSQKIIIPRGTIQAEEITVIEVPKKFQRNSVVVARRRGAAGAYSFEPPIPAYGQMGPQMIMQSQPGQSTTAPAAFMPPLQYPTTQSTGNVVYYTQIDNQQPQGYTSNVQFLEPRSGLGAFPAMQAPGVVAYSTATTMQPQIGAQSFQQQQQQGMMMMAAQQQQQQQLMAGVSPDDLSRMENTERVQVTKSLEDFQQARRAFMANTQNITQPSMQLPSRRSSRTSSKSSMVSDTSSQDSIYSPCEYCARNIGRRRQ